MTDHVSDGQIDRLVKARWLAIGLSPSDLAEALSAAVRSRFDDGERAKWLDADRLHQIADALEIPPDLMRSAADDASRTGSEHESMQALLDLRLLRAFRELQDSRTKRTLIHLAEQMVKRQMTRNDDTG